MPAPKLDNQLCFALYTASSHLTAIYRPLLDPLNLTYTQFIVLMALWEDDNVSISCLAKKAGLSKATMTPLLKRLEQKELIQRQMLDGNERQKNISLTDAGRELSVQGEKVAQKAFCASGLTKAQAKEMISLCNTLTRRKFSIEDCDD